MGEAYIIITGNPVDGFKYYGIYGDRTDAIIAAEAAKLEDNWWIAQLEPLESE